MSLFAGELPELRNYQVAAHEAIRQAAREMHKRILVMLSTGSGKTLIAMNLINETLKKGRRAMFVCDRKNLISQASNVAREYGLGNHGIIQADNPLLDLSRPFQIASIQTIARRGWPLNMDVIVIDECHAQYSAWTEFIMSEDCKAVVVGLSASPFSVGLGKMFTRLVNTATMAQLTDDGWLVPLRVFSCRRPDMDGAETSGGEWTDRAAEQRELTIIGDIVPEWRRFANGMKTIVFGSTILHCEELAKQFNENGVSAAVICAPTPDDERQRTFRAFAEGTIRVLVSVEALAKGFDQPDILCVCDCRPLRKSFSTAVQMWGRGLRPSKATGKTECRLLDFSGNIIRFADDWSNLYFNGLDKLDSGERLDKEIRKDETKEPKKCPRCGYTPMGGKKCVGCGYEIQQKALTEHLPGEMQEIRLKGKNGAVLAPNAAHMWAQLATYAKDHGKNYGWLWHRYQDLVGSEPPKGWHMETAPRVEPTRETLNKIRNLNIAFVKGMKKRESMGAAS